MSESARQDPLERLERALAAWLEYSDRGEGDVDTFLAGQDPEVAALLEPMLRDGQGEGTLGASSDSSDVEAATRDPSAGSQSQTHAVPGAPGDERRLGGFRVLREVGRGGMGVVFEAYDESLDRRVALKTLGGHVALSKHGLERFRREAAAAARLQHPGIAQVYDSGQDGTTHWIAMEFIEGQSLGDALAAGAPSFGTIGSKDRARRVAELIADVAEALDFAHEQHVVHRDIKPHNILLDRGGRPRVVDFGVAKLLDREQLSVTGDFAGSLAYASPEQLAGAKHVDARSDVWSLGVVLHECLSGRKPFDADTQQALVRNILTRDPPEAPAQRDLQTICLKALEKAPDRRYASAGDLAADLRRWLHDEPIEASRPSAASRLMRLARRRRGGLVAAVALIAAVGIGIAWSVDRDQGDELIDQLVASAATSLNQLDRMIGSDRNIKSPAEVTRHRERIEALITEAERVLALRPTHAQLRWTTIRAHERGAQLYHRVQIYDAALCSHDRGIELLESILAEPEIDAPPNKAPQEGSAQSKASPTATAKSRTHVENQLAKVFLNRHVLRREMGRHDEADRDLSRAMQLYEGVLERKNRKVGANETRFARMGLAIALNSRARKQLGTAPVKADLARASELWTLAAQQQSLPSSQLAHAYDSKVLLAEANFIEGDLDAADKSAQGVVAESSKQPTTVRERSDVIDVIAKAQQIRAWVAQARVDYKGAQVALEAALELRREQARDGLAAHRQQLAMAESDLAALHLDREEDLEVAGKLIGSALATCDALIAKKNTAQRRQLRARLLGSRARLYALDGHSEKDTEAAWKRSAAMRQALFDDGIGSIEDVAGALGAYGCWLHERKRYAPALEILEKAWAASRKALDAKPSDPRIRRNHRAQARCLLSCYDRLQQPQAILRSAEQLHAQMGDDVTALSLSLMGLERSIARTKLKGAARKQLGVELAEKAIRWIRAADTAGVVGWRQTSYVRKIKLLRRHSVLGPLLDKKGSDSR